MSLSLQETFNPFPIEDLGDLNGCCPWTGTNAFFMTICTSNDKFRNRHLTSHCQWKSSHYSHSVLRAIVDDEITGITRPLLLLCFSSHSDNSVPFSNGVIAFNQHSWGLKRPVAESSLQYKLFRATRHRLNFPLHRVCSKTLGDCNFA